MAPPVVDQEFVVHLSALGDGPQSELAYQQLRRLWTVCRQQLGMSGPIAGIDAPDWLPVQQARLPSGDVLAAQERVGVKDRQCVLRRAGELLNLSVVLAQPQPQGSGRGRARATAAARLRRSGTARLGWIEFSQLWSRARGGGTDALLGEATVLIARASNKRNGAIAATAQLAESLAPLLPYDERRPANWDRHGITSRDGFGVWDTGPAGEAKVRELLVIAPADADRKLSTWVWSDGTPALPLLARYLLNTAVLRYQAQVLKDWHSTPRLTDLDALLTEVAATFEPVKSTNNVGDQDRGRLLDSLLNRLVSTELRLRALHEHLQQIAQTAQHILPQLTAAWGENPATEPSVVIAADLGIGRWLIDQATYELNSHRIRLDRTVAARQLVAEELDRFPRPHDLPPTSSRPPSKVVSRSSVPEQPDVSRKVFVVHGRDTELLERFWTFLQALDLRPQDWELLVSATGGTSPTLMDVVRRAPEIAQATLVLMSPDDMVELQPELRNERDSQYETAPGCQARPNVLLELGMALMAYPERTIVVEIGALRPIADLAGLNVIRFDGSVQSIDKVIKRLREAGCPVDDSDTDLRDPKRFAGLRAYSRRHNVGGS